jgi:polysaccharide pyruvyl transferase WcaK-like protein
MAAIDRPTRIGFLISYGGSNLGDGAIQTAILHNLSKRLPTAEFYGVNLCPRETQKRHGIPAFPITGLAVEFYSSLQTLFGKDDSPPQQRQSDVVHRPIDRLTEAVKKIPVLGGSSRFVLRRLRETQNIIREIRHLIRSYFFIRKLDLLVISGSGQLMELFGGPWGHPYALFRWALLAKLTKTRIAVASVGITGSLETSLSKYFIKIALATACYRSYRDEGTKQLLRSWRFTHRDPCVPDLAFSLDSSRYDLSDPANTHDALDRIVAVGPMSYANPGYWPMQDRATYDRYLDELTDFTHWLIERNYRILLFVSTSSDRAAVADLKGRLRNRYGEHALTQLVEPSVNDLEDLIRSVSAAEFVIATRFHGVLLSHLLLKPVIAISYDRKVEAHMRDLHQLPYHFDIRGVSTPQLCESFALLEANAAQVRAEVNKSISTFRIQLDSQYEQLVKHATTA